MRERKLLVPIFVLLVICCLLAAGVALVNYFSRPAMAQTRPVVLINSPQDGEQVEVGRTVPVHVIATDEAKITRMELWVDGELHTAQGSSLPGGVSPCPLVVQWNPLSAGTHTLIARAFNAQGVRAHSAIDVQANEPPDRDGDGVADDVDFCPDEPGSPAAGGCTDRDHDAVPDAADDCPDEPGLPEGGGCPGPVEGDRDGDGVPDESDDSPDEPGTPGTEGRPDRDSDGIPDDADSCPDEPGAPEDGCPAPTSDDRDGDGIPDAEDECPDEPGPPWTWGCPDRDGDGVRDGVDECPDVPGLPENRGCPVLGGDDGDGGDSDGDGVLDDADACPDEHGDPEHDGCPDHDGDGVPDGEDLCPDEAGPEEGAGCPGHGTGDRDGDGVPDDVDPCPDEEGLPEHDGCPPPGEGGDEDGDGIPDDEEPPGDDSDGLFDFGDIAPAEERLRVPVEFQALSFQVSDDYDEINCYASLAGSDVERYGPFEPLDERQWEIPADLGSVRLAAPMEEPLEVQVECGGSDIHMGEEGGWEAYFNLGSYAASHPLSDWDGHVITARSTGGDEGRSFEATYRICLGSCEDAAFSPPVLSLYHYGGDAVLIWMWDGNREHIDGFHVYVDGSRAFSVPADASSQSVLGYRPLCGSGRREFSITAFRDDRESPPSNRAYWSAQPCPRVVRITFEALTTYHMGDDEWWADGESVGPIYGNFYASAAREEQLRFFAVDYGNWWGERDHGYRLRHTRYYPVQDIFDWIQRELSYPCGEGACPGYYGPESSSFAMELGPYQDLTLGARIMDQDSDNRDDVLFEADRTLSSDEVYPRRVIIDDRNMSLSVLIDVLVGPEAGDEPDLVVSDVTQHEDSGQLRIHVFNNAADFSGDISVNLVRISTNEQIDLRTWRDVTIPSGGERILQSGELVMAPSDLRVIVDPANDIPETNDGNNIYETPVRMRVEFLRVGAPFCNEWSCSIVSCDSEHVFKLWTGHGSSGSEINWVARNVRFPRSGELEATCGHHCGDTDPDEDWIMEGDLRYTFEFEMEVSENLYVMVTGYEKDGPTSDDSLGRVFVEYDQYQEWGASPDAHEGEHGSETPCDDWFCSPCPRGLWAQWRITKVE